MGGVSSKGGKLGSLWLLPNLRWKMLTPFAMCLNFFDKKKMTKIER